MNINLKNLSPQEIVIEIEGPIDNQHCTAEKQLTAAIKAGVKKVRVNIRSTGGSVNEALLIHSALSTLPKEVQVETHCYGFVASAATIIAQAASKGGRYVASSALYLIHSASTSFEGNAIDANSTAALLAKTDRHIASIYAQRAGGEVEHFAHLMAKDGGRGEWLSAQEAVNAGLADQVEQISPIKNAIGQIQNLIRKLFEKPNLSENLAENFSENLAGNLAENFSKDLSENLSKDLSKDLAENLSKSLSETVKTIKPLGLEDVIATSTEPKDDPVIEHNSVELTHNQAAYKRDINIFRE